MTTGGHVGFGATGNRSNQCSIPQNPTLESNTRSTGPPVTERSSSEDPKMVEVWRSRDAERRQISKICWTSLSS